MSASIASIGPEALARRIGTADAPLVFDVRRRPVFEKADRLIAGARWRDHRKVEEWVAPLPKAAEVVVYCVHGHQVSQAAVARLRAQGCNASYLEGGIDAYLAASGPTILKAAGLPAAFDAPTRWITRERPKIDRIACPWFIRRFVDPEAEILYVSADWVREAAGELDAIPFDIPDTEYSHVGDQCSFDAFLARFGVEDDALDRLALIVRGADTARPDLAPEASGLLAMSLGLSAQLRSDHATLEQGMVLYDALYSWARDAAGEGHDWKPQAVAS